MLSSGGGERSAGPPLEEIAHLFEDVEVLLVFNPGTFLLDEKRHRIHAEARHAELQPEAHDLVNLGADVRIPGVEVRLMIVKPVEIVLAGLAVERPRGGL